MFMKNNLAIICSYHDISKIIMSNILKNLSKLSDRLFLINNVYCCSDRLKELYDKYGKYNGIQFDELNAQSFYCDVMDDNAEFVYNTHYRRCLTITPSTGLNKNQILCSLSDKAYNIQILLRNWLFNNGIKDNTEIMGIIKRVFSVVFLIETEDTDKYFKFNTLFGHELYVMPKELFVDMVHKSYDFIELICKKIIDSDYISLLDRNDFMDILLESFVSFYITWRKNSEEEGIGGYEVVRYETKMI